MYKRKTMIFDYTVRLNWNFLLKSKPEGQGPSIANKYVTHLFYRTLSGYLKFAFSMFRAQRSQKIETLREQEETFNSFYQLQHYRGSLTKDGKRNGNGSSCVWFLCCS